MPRVFIPPLLQPLTLGERVIDVEGQTVREVIDQLDCRFPGFRERLVENDQLKSGLNVAIGNKVASRGLLQKTAPQDEVHFLPAIGGG